MGITGYTPKRWSENGADIFGHGVFEAHICKIDFKKMKSWTNHFESQSLFFEAQDMMSSGLRWIDSHCHWWTQTCSNILFLLVTHFQIATRRVFLLVMGPYLCDPTGSGDESQNVDCQFQVCLQPIQLHCMNVDLTNKYIQIWWFNYTSPWSSEA